MKIFSIIIASLVLLIISVGIGFQIRYTECVNNFDFVGTATMIVLGFTLIILLHYNVATQGIAKATREQNEFSTIFSIHEKLSTRKSHLMRWYLHKHFERDFASAVKKCFDEKYTLGQGEQVSVNINNVLNEWDEKLNDKTDEFRKRLKENNNMSTYLNKEDLRIESPFELVERILLDFDFIAIPYCREIEAAKSVAKVYRDVLKRTAAKILPFIAIQHKLRDENYKKHYLFLLSELKINIQGLKIPKKKELFT